MKSKLLLPVFLCFVPVLACAEQKIDCPDTTGNTMAMRYCHGEELKKWDGQLNATYQEFLDLLRSLEKKFSNMPSGTLVEGIRKAQREWIEYRDRSCEFHSYLIYGGTLASVYRLDCEIRMTKSRLEELKLEIKDWKGN